MNGAHLGRENGIALQEHIVGELSAVICCRSRVGEDAVFLPLLHGCKQAADADTGCTEIVDLVDFQYRIELVASLQNLADLIGCHRIKAAAKGIELDQLKILTIADKLRGGIEAGVIDPLVVDTERPFRRKINGETVLRQHRKTVRGDHFRNTVIDLRVDVIGSSC